MVPSQLPKPIRFPSRSQKPVIRTFYCCCKAIYEFEGNSSIDFEKNQFRTMFTHNLKGFTFLVNLRILVSDF